MQNNVEVVVRGIWTVEYIDGTDGDKAKVYVASDAVDACQFAYAQTCGWGTNVRILWDGVPCEPCPWCKGEGGDDAEDSFGRVIGWKPCSECKGTSVQ